LIPALPSSPSWPGFVPAIHVFSLTIQDVDARDKRGHDDVICRTALPNYAAFSAATM
jgi:hypothetical protein